MEYTEFTGAVADEVCDFGEPEEGGVQAAREHMLDGHAARSLAGLFKALSDPTRLRLISALATGEFCVNTLSAALDMEQSAVSHQLSAMRDMHLVSRRRAGRHVYYRLDDEHVRDLFAQGLAHAKHL